MRWSLFRWITGSGAKSRSDDNVIGNKTPCAPALVDDKILKFSLVELCCCKERLMMSRCGVCMSGCQQPHPPPTPKHDFWAAHTILSKFHFQKNKVSNFFAPKIFFTPPKKKKKKNSCTSSLCRLYTQLWVKQGATQCCQAFCFSITYLYGGTLTCGCLCWGAFQPKEVGKETLRICCLAICISDTEHTRTKNRHLTPISLFWEGASKLSLFRPHLVSPAGSFFRNKAPHPHLRDNRLT